MRGEGKHAINKAWRPRAPPALALPRYAIITSSYPSYHSADSDMADGASGSAERSVQVKLVLLGTPFPEMRSCRSSDLAPVVCIASAGQRLCCAVQAVVGGEIMTE